MDTTDETRARLLRLLEKSEFNNQWFFLFAGVGVTLLFLMLPLGYLLALVAITNAADTGSIQSLANFVASFVPEVVGITFTVLILDRRAEKRAQEQLKAQLIREMSSCDNGISQKAVKELDVRGWLKDGSLQQANLREANLQKASLAYADPRKSNLSGADLEGADLRFANLFESQLIGTGLQKAYLRGADLTDANLFKANLREANLADAKLRGAHMHAADLVGSNLFQADLHNACLAEANLQDATLNSANLEGVDFTDSNLENARHLHEEQLSKVYKLRGATLPNIGIYDGRFRLRGDIEIAESEGVDVGNSSEMADFYGVTLEAYLAGQSTS